MCPAAFAIRGRELVVYILADGSEQKALLSKLGKHKMGKSCLSSGWRTWTRQSSSNWW
jgi:hypothetical protein